MPVFSPLHTWEQQCPQYWILCHCQPELNPLVLDYPKRNNSLWDTYHLYDHPNPQTQRSQHRVVQFQLNTWCVRMLIIWIWLGTGLQTGGSLYEHLKTINYNSHFVAKILVKFQIVEAEVVDTLNMSASTMSDKLNQSLIRHNISCWNFVK